MQLQHTRETTSNQVNTQSFKNIFETKLGMMDDKHVTIVVGSTETERNG